MQRVPFNEKEVLKNEPADDTYKNEIFRFVIGACNCRG